MSRKKIRVLVTAVGGGGHGEQIVKALRLGALDYSIVGADMTPLCAGRSLVDEFVVLPPANHPEYLDQLMELAVSKGIQALFHGCEQEMALFSRNRERIEAAGVYVPVNPPHVLEICLDKARTNDKLRDLGFNPPRFGAVECVEDAESVDFLPVVLKPSIGGGGSAHVYVAQTGEELEMFVKYLLGFCPRVLAQEYVGVPEAEFTVGVLFGRDGVLLNSIAVRRLVHGAMSTRLRVPNKTGRADLGEHLVISSGISQGELGKWPEVTRACEAIAGSLGAQAPVNIQCRLVDGVVKVFEINPRFSGTTSLRAMSGYNEPEVLIRRDLLGEEIEPGFPFVSGTVLRSLKEIRLEDSLQVNATAPTWRTA